MIELKGVWLMTKFLMRSDSTNKSDDDNGDVTFTYMPRQILY